MCALDRTLDVVGVGFGPANLALAICLREQRPVPRALFFESREQFGWHPGMMLDRALVQNHFLKDLISLRNPRSEFSFTSYLHDHGRLHRFVNLPQHHPTRWEFDDYLRWAAMRFQESVCYGWRVTRVAPKPGHDGLIGALSVRAINGQGETRDVTARQLVIATGGQPNMLSDVLPASRRIVHSAHFLDKFPSAFGDPGKALRVAVAGSGQSGAEITRFLLERYPRANVDWIVSGAAPRPADDTPFVNDIFMTEEVDRHHAAVDPHGDCAYHSSLRNSNYGVADAALLASLYQWQYDDLARREHRLRIRTRERLRGASEEQERLVLELDGSESRVAVDLLVLATGYSRLELPDFAHELTPLVRHDTKSRPIIERGYRLAMRDGADVSVYVQGLAERTHGLGETLLPILPFRAAEISSQISQATRPRRATAYPPSRHLELRRERLYEVIRRYPLATLISHYEGRMDASHVPMILEDGDHPSKLFGHLDAENPQAWLLADREFLAIFQGPNAYISPQVYQTDQLPTWNFVSVHVRGRAQRIRSRDELVGGLQSIPVHNDAAPGAYRLDAGDRRISQLIDGIVGFRFEITEIEGRFKLSQDRESSDRAHACEELIGVNAHERAEFLHWLADGTNGSTGEERA